MPYRMRYGKFELVTDTGETRAGWRPAEVVSDVLGALGREEDDLRRNYLPYLVSRYGVVALPQASGSITPSRLRRLGYDEPWWQGLSEDLTAYAVAGRRGRFVPDFDPPAPLRTGIGGALGSVIWRGGGEFAIVPTKEGAMQAMPALLAVCLLEMLRDGPLPLRRCNHCQLLWVTDTDARYCDRPAPGGRTSCRKIKTRRASTRRAPLFQKERKRLYERVRRRTLPSETYRAWLKENRPGKRDVTWVTYEEWLAGKGPRKKR